MTKLLLGPRYDDNKPVITHVWFDIDNTLVDNNSSALPSDNFVKTAIAAGKKATLGIASARPLAKAKHIIDACQMTSLSILSNGAQIYDGPTGTFALEYVIPGEPALLITQILQQMEIEHWVQDDGVDHFWLGELTTNDTLGDYAKSPDIWQPISDGNRTVVNDYVPTKPFVIVANRVTPEYLEAVQEIANHFADQHITSLIAHEYPQEDGSVLSEVFFLDDRANKKTALVTVVEMLKANHEQTMAVGDGPNDTVIVAGAGVGVAVGNAVDATKAVATYIAPSVGEDGAAIALQELVLN